MLLVFVDYRGGLKGCYCRAYRRFYKGTSKDRLEKATGQWAMLAKRSLKSEKARKWEDVMWCYEKDSETFNLNFTLFQKEGICL